MLNVMIGSDNGSIDTNPWSRLIMTYYRLAHGNRLWWNFNQCYFLLKNEYWKAVYKLKAIFFPRSINDSDRNAGKEIRTNSCLWEIWGLFQRLFSMFPRINPLFVFIYKLHGWMVTRFMPTHAKRNSHLLYIYSTYFTPISMSDILEFSRSNTRISTHLKIKVNSLGPSDAIWRWRSWSTLVRVMAITEPMLTNHQ